MNSAENALIEQLDSEFSKLNRLRKAAGIDGQINKIDFSIRKCSIDIKDDRKLDVEVTVTPLRKDAEYASMLDYWVDVKPRLLSTIHPGLKAKETYELMYAVLLYDGTFKADGTSARARAIVHSALEGLLKSYLGAKAEQPSFYRYQGRSSRAQPGTDAHKFHQGMFLSMNKGALHSLLFSQKVVIAEINSKSAELAAGGEYKKLLYGIIDSVQCRITPKNCIEGD
jgi:hypothetical protein